MSYCSGNIFTIYFSTMFQVEELISDLPSLTVFDEFVLKACGFYCQASCKRGRGFPSVILKQWKSCSFVPSVHVVLPSSDDVNGPPVMIDVNLSVGPSDVNNTQPVIDVDQTLPPSDVNGTRFVMVRNIQHNMYVSMFSSYYRDFPSTILFVWGFCTSTLYSTSTPSHHHLFKTALSF